MNKDVNTTPPPKESNGLYRRAKARPPGNQAVTEFAEISEFRDKGNGAGIRHPGATTKAYTEKKHSQIIYRKRGQLLVDDFGLLRLHIR